MGSAFVAAAAVVLPSLERPLRACSAGRGAALGAVGLATTCLEEAAAVVRM